MHIKFFSKLEKHWETIGLEITENGWNTIHQYYGGTCDPAGRPYLLHCFKENYASCPPAFTDAFEELWSAAKSRRLEVSEVQHRLDIFSQWLFDYQKTGNPLPFH